MLLLYREVPSQLNWACEICGRPFGRRYSAERHVRLKHNGRGMVIDYPSYLVNVLSGRSPRPATVDSGKREGSFQLDLFDKAYEELERRAVQSIADMMDPVKIAERNVRDTEAMIKLFQQYKENLPILITTKPKKRLIGYRGHVCERCFTAEALEVYLSGKELSERKHQCDPTRIFRADIFNADGTIRHLSDELPRMLFESVKAWAKDRKYLQAVKVERNENCIELCSISENRWAYRAINGRTTLDDNELLAFLKKAKATFGIFKIKKGKVEDFYYMMISDVPSKIIK